MTVCASFLLKMAACFCRVFLLKKHFIDRYMHRFDGMLPYFSWVPWHLSILKKRYFICMNKKSMYIHYRQKQVVSRE